MTAIPFSLLLNKNSKYNGNQICLKITSSFFRVFIKPLICLLVFSILTGLLINARGQKLNYTVVRNGSDAGWLKMEKINAGNLCRLTLVSEIKFRMVFLLTASVSESASFDDGRLISSVLYHKINGRVKVNKKMQLTETGYEVSEENEKEKLALPSISYNLLCLYFREPVGIKKVYCDKQESFANIEKTADGGYKVRFPDGNINTYYYSHGQCVKVKIAHTLYTATMLLTSLK